MLRASRIHNKTEDSLAKYRQWEFFIKTAGDLLSALAKLGLFLGIVNVFLYILKIEFMPSGLSMADGITFIFTFLAVSFISIVGTIYGFFTLFWIYFLIDGIKNKRWLRKKQENFQATSQLPSWAQSGWWTTISGFIFFYFIISFLLIWLNSKAINDSTMFFLCSILVAGTLFSVVVLAQNDTEKNGISNFNKIILLLLIPLIIWLWSKGESSSFAMKLIGIRYNSVSIETTSENIKRVRSLTKAFNIHIETCPLTGSDHQLILNANILWTGIGNRTLVELVNPRTFVELNDAPKKFLSIQFDSSSVWPVYAQTVRSSSNRAILNPSHCQR